MELTDQVCTFEQAKKLKELNLKLKSVFCFQENDNSDCPQLLWYNLHYEDENSCPAPTVAELMRILHKYSNWEFIDLRENQAEYLAEILINEINDGQINPRDLKL